MIARILDGHGIGSAEAAIHYIAGDLNHKGEARDKVIHLFGDGQLVIDVTEAMTCKHRYLSSVLSFTKEESERLDMDDIRELAEQFSNHHAHPFGTNNIADCAYLHIQDGRYDVHLVQAQYDMESGKRVDLYLDNLWDTKRIADWQDIKTFEYKLDDPRDPARQRLTKERIQEAKNRKEMRSFINMALEQAHLNGEINSQDNVCQQLESLGFTIARQTKSSISVTSPDLKKNIRLTGAIYRESYAGIKDSQRAIEESQRRAREDRREQYNKAKKRLEQSNQKRTERLSKKLKINLTERLQEAGGNTGEEGPDDLHTIFNELNSPHDTYITEFDRDRTCQDGLPSTQRLSNKDVTRENLRNNTAGEIYPNQRWSVSGQGGVNDDNAPSYNQITNAFAILSRTQLHAATMRKISQSNQSIERAGQRLEPTDDSQRPTGSTTRGSLVSAIERIAKGIAQWVEELTSARNYTP